MQLTHENRRTRWRWLLGAWILVGALAGFHTVLVRDYVALLDSMGLAGAVAPETPLSRPCPTAFADAQMWVRHALRLSETDAWRIRHTDVDNAPFGREVHWNSAFAWLIAVHGQIRHWVLGEPVPMATERALAWFNLPLLLAVVVLFSTWTARRAGALAGVFVAVAILCMPDFYPGFVPNYVDHHGVLSAANFGLVLGAFFMGAGWSRASPAGSVLLPASRFAARRAALFSALSGAIGMWISAPSVVPAIGIVGIAGLLATWWHGRRAAEHGATFDAGLWRLWGRTGAAGCLGFYLLEYAPFHLDWRLEVNHPLYALAWWGGGEIVAGLSEWRQRTSMRPPLWSILLALAAIAAPAAAILMGGTRVFAFRDPFLQGLSAHVAEGLALPEAIRTAGWSAVIGSRLLWLVTGLVVPFGLAVAGRRRDRLPMGFLALGCAAFVSMPLIQVRFFMNAAGPLICATLAAMAALSQGWSQRGRAVLVLGVTAIALIPTLIFLNQAHGQLRRREVTPSDALQPLYRSIAARLRTDRPADEIVLLTNPDASTGVGYYGRLKTIGTLYWECVDGMKAAVGMTASKSMDEARARLLERGVTHVAAISESSLVREGYELINPGAKPDEWSQCFGAQTLAGRNIPLWLEALAYTPPADVALPNLRVILFKTHFSTPVAEEEYRAAQVHKLAGRTAEAEQAVDRALAIDRASAEFWLLKGELLLTRGALPPAIDAIDQCLAHAPATNRAQIARSAANVLYRQNAIAAAVRFLRVSLESRFEAATASTLAWILATSRDESVRDGKTAVAIGRRVAAENPDSPAAVTALAAAFAETGAFSEAIASATRALELARAAGNASMAAGAEAQLRAYQAGQPWRQ